MSPGSIRAAPRVSFKIKGIPALSRRLKKSYLMRFRGGRRLWRFSGMCVAKRGQARIAPAAPPKCLALTIGCTPRSNCVHGFCRWRRGLLCPCIRPNQGCIYLRSAHLLGQPSSCLPWPISLYEPDQAQAKHRPYRPRPNRVSSLLAKGGPARLPHRLFERYHKHRPGRIQREILGLLFATLFHGLTLSIATLIVWVCSKTM